MNKHLSRIWMAAAIVPLIAGTALASSPAMFVCRGDSIARPTCCCPESQHRAPAPMSAPTLSASCCCDILRVAVPATPAVLDSWTTALAAHHEDVAPPPGVAMAPAASRLDGRPLGVLRRPPLPAAPVLLRKQSFLI